MALISAIEPFNAQVPWHSPPGNALCGNIFKPCEKAPYILVGLILPPCFTRMDVNIVNPPTGGLLDAISDHKTQLQALRAMTASASRG
ncbi:hypothetical protein BV95_04514 [Sphingobium chlorophenolicum]|uniref:Uncharacterized protein n=1 Tax=Sphingobium chlorophenolicum TaxID=46429 RepID=A0A081R4R9_SPHCR|nr:hypothetical protein BV95_04514 [Sphingobium chlorophenolicum]